MNIVVGVCGGIAAYKTAHLVRLFKKTGHDVRVVMTDSAQQFVTSMTFQALSGNEVATDLWDEQQEAAMGHISLAKWADWIVIAPATANTLSKIAQGIGDNLLTTTVLVSDARLALLPAMNQQMWASSAVQANVAELVQRDVVMIGPDSGEQACGDVGAGRMVEPEQALKELGEIWHQSWSGKLVLITAGPTLEDIDPVRFIGNRSSGKMGYALAEQAARQGAEVILVSGPVALKLNHPNTDLIHVRSAQQMMDAVQAQLESNEFDVFIGAAAVADYTPIQVSEQKIKKSEHVSDEMVIQLKKNPDIIAGVAAHVNRPQCVLGFAAETQDVVGYAQSKLARKNLDWIAANDVSQSEIGFDSNENAITLIGKDSTHTIKQASKTHVAKELLEIILKDLEGSIHE